jgi:hypothetical protein
VVIVADGRVSVVVDSNAAAAADDDDGDETCKIDDGDVSIDVEDCVSTTVGVGDDTETHRHGIVDDTDVVTVNGDGDCNDSNVDDDDEYQLFVSVLIGQQRYQELLHQLLHVWKYAVVYWCSYTFCLQHSLLVRRCQVL